jgi:hypothetical protein
MYQIQEKMRNCVKNKKASLFFKFEYIQIILTHTSSSVALNILLKP